MGKGSIRGIYTGTTWRTSHATEGFVIMVWLIDRFIDELLVNPVLDRCSYRCDPINVQLGIPWNPKFSLHQWKHHPESMATGTKQISYYDLYHHPSHQRCWVPWYGTQILTSTNRTWKPQVKSGVPFHQIEARLRKDQWIMWLDDKCHRCPLISGPTLCPIFLPNFRIVPIWTFQRFSFSARLLSGTYRLGHRWIYGVHRRQVVMPMDWQNVDILYFHCCRVYRSKGLVQRSSKSSSPHLHSRAIMDACSTSQAIKLR